MESIAAFGLDVVVRVTLVLLLAFACVGLLRRRSAAARHVVWGSALVAVVAMPWIVGLAPRAVVQWLPASWSSAPQVLVDLPQVDADTDPVAAGTEPGIASAVGSAEDRSNAMSSAARSEAAPPATARVSISWAAVVLGVWSIGAFASLLLLFRRIRATHQVLRRASASVPARWRAAVDFAERAVAPRRRARLVASSSVASPWVWDPGRAWVVVPADAGDWDAARCRAALVHEFAHVRRRDGWLWLCGCVAGALFWFHPLVWFARRWLYLEQEQACDDAVLGAGCVGSEYAAHLLSLSRQQLVSLPSVAMARPSEMAKRLTHLLEPHCARSRSSPAFVVVALLPLLALWSCLGVVDPDARPDGVEAGAGLRESTSPRIEALAALDDPERHDAAVASLVGFGEAGVPFLAAELGSAAKAGASPRTIGILQALATLGPVAQSARPAVEPLAAQSIPLRELTIVTLAAMRGEAGWTWIADYSQNEILAVDAEAREVAKISEVYGAWDVELLEDGSLLIAEFALNRVREIGRDGREIWVYDSLKNPYSAQRLPNGNTLIADTFGKRVIEVDRRKRIVWSVDGVKPYDAERLADGNTLIADGEQDRVLIVDPDGVTVREVRGLASVHDVDMQPNGNLLVTQRTLHSVVEIDPRGATVWKLEVVYSDSRRTGGGSPSDADRLPNGNTLVAENGRVAEYDPNGALVWERDVSWAVEANRY